MDNIKKICALFIVVGLVFSGCGKETLLENFDEKKAYEVSDNYGVFIGIDENTFDENHLRIIDYSVVVIDADALSDVQIAKLKEKCDLVYSYIDIGSLENYRSYYQRFEKMKLDLYMGWPDEYWMNVSKKEWQEFILDEYALELISKGIDGLFVDNLDVYYQYSTSDIYDGCELIMRGLMEKDIDIIINGGDFYVKDHLQRNGTINDILTGINQEITDENELDYYKAYVEEMASQGANIYIIEYTDNKKIVENISQYCIDKGFLFYITKSLELQ